mmetsp:Transcript_27113/g.64529  ORF Transcript_27113/g.64529 Transcript_27113/m.64529 type:complete len:209 (+) Transcript_27113:979-1605(+)
MQAGVEQKCWKPNSGVDAGRKPLLQLPGLGKLHRLPQQPIVCKDGAHQVTRVTFVQDHWARCTISGTYLPKLLQAKGVKGPAPHAMRSCSNQLPRSALHLLGSLLSESEEHHLGGRHLARQEVLQALHQRQRLAAARPRQHQHWAQAHRHRLLLASVQLCQVRQTRRPRRLPPLRARAAQGFWPASGRGKHGCRSRRNCMRQLPRGAP